MFFKTYWLLWQNARNLNYIKEYNDKFARRLADSKIRTKDFLRISNIAIPETIKVLEHKDEISEKVFDNLNPPFVVKPNGGFWGKGILVFTEISYDGKYITNNWLSFSKKDLLVHFWDILDWFYSLSWNRDKVIIERKIEIDEEIELLWKYWLPDIRIIVFNMVPVMAMLRVPTKESSWKANLHAGACWVWIDIWTGRLTYIVEHSRIVKSIPGIWDVRWLELPHWNNALALAVGVQKVTKVGYLWCDIVLDKEFWPLILEINIRPWLEVQIANMSPLKDRLERVEGIYVNSVEKGVRLWKDLFSWIIDEQIKNISWKKVVWTREYLHIEYNEKKYKYLAEIKSGNVKNYIDKDFALNVLKVSKNEITKGVVKCNLQLLQENKKARFVIKELWSVNIILGISVLRWFLIDPFKYKKWELPSWDNIELHRGKNTAIKRNYENLVKKIDDDLMFVDKKLLILKYFTPCNLKEEKQKFIESNWKYIPKLKYIDFPLDLDFLEEKVNSIEISDIPLAWIYKRKQEEIIVKIKLLRAFKEQDYKNISIFSEKLYWSIDLKNLDYVKYILDNKKVIKEEDIYLNFEEIKEMIKRFNHIYSIDIVLRRWEKTARFVMKWNILFIREWAKVWKKELRSIIAHEIEGHYLRRINWKAIEYSIFSHGSKSYLEIDEWIAVYNQNRFLGENDRKFYWIFERYYFLNYAIHSNYEELLKEMILYYNNDLDRVFNYLLRLKRWMSSFSDNGVFIKDSVYVNGYFKVNSFIDLWWKLEELYIWKISLEDINEIRESYFIKFDFTELKTPFFIKNK